MKCYSSLPIILLFYVRFFLMQIFKLIVLNRYLFYFGYTIGWRTKRLRNKFRFLISNLCSVLSSRGGFQMDLWGLRVPSSRARDSNVIIYRFVFIRIATITSVGPFDYDDAKLLKKMKKIIEGQAIKSHRYRR